MAINNSQAYRINNSKSTISVYRGFVLKAEEKAEIKKLTEIGFKVKYVEKKEKKDSDSDKPKDLTLDFITKYLDKIGGGALDTFNAKREELNSKGNKKGFIYGKKWFKETYPEKLPKDYKTNAEYWSNVVKNETFETVLSELK